MLFGRLRDVVADVNDAAVRVCGREPVKASFARNRFVFASAHENDQLIDLRTRRPDDMRVPRMVREKLAEYQAAKHVSLWSYVERCDRCHLPQCGLSDEQWHVPRDRNLARGERYVHPSERTGFLVRGLSVRP